MARLSFATDIVPMFRPGDVQCMNGFGVSLADYAYMSDAAADAMYKDHANARHVLGRLEGTETPRMPKGGPFWNAVKLDKFKQWMDEGYQP